MKTAVVKTAVVQEPPVYLNKAKTLEKAVALIAQAAKKKRWR